MICGYCGTRNGDGEHRCTRCGRKPDDTLIGGFAMQGVDGALATQLSPSPRMQLVERAQPEQTTRTEPNLSRAVQASLFPSNVISMPAPLAPKARARADTAVKPPSQKPAARRPKQAPEGQGTLDFLPPAPSKPRTLPTTVEAVIYCEAPVATTLHRAVASALDCSMVLLGYGLFVLTFHFLGGRFELTRSNLTLFGGMFVLIGLLYGFLFAWAGVETAGMRWTQLRLTTFDGFPPEYKHYLLRYVASSLGRCTLLGLLWSVADEESLGWQDHISRTFPTPRDSKTLVFREE